MACIKYRSIKFRSDSIEQIEFINGILGEYDGQKLTARQVYYRLVAADRIPNTPRSYQNLTTLLTNARYAGKVDWDIIEDRGREASVWSEYASIVDSLERALYFRLPRWADQPRYVELWVEKQALAGVLEPIAMKHHVPLSVNKGYSSASAMKTAADRMRTACGLSDDPGEDYLTDVEREVVIIYLGDHDPSGEDMVRDIRDRLIEFGVPNLDVRKAALTMTQVQRYNPPPNPAKTTDSRYETYRRAHGEHSWELDAIPPRDLNLIVEQALAGLVDKRRMDAVITEEKRQRVLGEAQLKTLGRKIAKAG